jgi:tetratricopeptide (TPR) repeat protein
VRRGPTILALVGLTVSTSSTVASCNDAQRRHDRRWLKELTPAPLGVERPVTGEPRVARIRVLADEDFRAQHVHWKQEVQEQLDDANQLLIPALGVKLEVAAMEPWASRSASRSLGDVLADLERKDPADDVAWVVGMVSSLSIVSAGFDQLGVARPLGRHFVLRGFADLQERKEFEKGLPSLSAAEREWLFDARRQHKLTALFVHELAHTLGAPHETDAAWVMHPQYQTGMATLSDQSRRLMSVALEGWLVQPHEAATVTAGRLLTFLDQNPWGGWSEDDAELLRATLQQLASAPVAGPAERPDLGVPAAAFQQFQTAQSLAQRGKYPEALADLDALIAAYPSAAELRVAVCQVMLAKDGAAAATAIAACDRALEVSPKDPRPIFARVEALMIGGQKAEALALVAKAEAIAATAEDDKVWEQIAAIYQGQVMISAAERAIGHTAAGPDHPLRSWASRLRARYGLPPSGKAAVPAADEGAYVAAVREILDLVYASKFADATAQAKAAERRWPRTPGVLGARCDLALRQGATGAATALCDQAIKQWPGAAWAQYLRGVMLLQRGKTRPAIAALRAAISGEPELAAAYRTLGKAYSLAGDKPGHDALDTDYQQRFGNRLPE